jgi:CRP-like cAMP-binding protein
VLGLEGPDLRYRAVVFVDDFAHMGGVRSEYIANFWYAADRAGIRLPPRATVMASDASGLTAGGADKAPLLARKLGTISLFKRSPQLTAEIAAHCRIERYRRGEHLLKVAHRSQVLFAVMSGSVEAYLVNGSERTLVEEFTPAELIIFKTTFRNAPAPFDVVAATDVEAISIPIKQLALLLDASPDLRANVEHMLALRERVATRGLANAAVAGADAQPDREAVLRAMFQNGHDRPH